MNEVPLVTSAEAKLLKGRVVIDRTGGFDVTVTWNDRGVPVATVDCPNGAVIDLGAHEVRARVASLPGWSSLLQAAALAAWDRMTHEYPLPGTYRKVVIVPAGTESVGGVPPLFTEADLIVTDNGKVLKDRYGKEGSNPAALALAIDRLEQGRAVRISPVERG